MKLLGCTCTLLLSTQNLAIQRVDNSILRVNLYLKDSTVGLMTLTHWKASYWLNSIIYPKNNSDINWFFSRWVWTKHTLLLTWPWLFEGKITLFTRLTSIQWIAQCALLTLLRWIAIYPLDSVIHPSNNKGRIEIFSMESKWSFISTTRAMD